MRRLFVVLILFALALPAFASNATLTVATVARTGTDRTMTAASDTMYFANNGKTWIEIANASGGSVTVTVASQVTDLPQGVAASNVAVAVAAATQEIIGPFLQSSWNNSTGLVTVTVSATASVTVQARKLP